MDQTQHVNYVLSECGVTSRLRRKGAKYKLKVCGCSFMLKRIRSRAQHRRPRGAAVTFTLSVPPRKAEIVSIAANGIAHTGVQDMPRLQFLT